MSLHRLQKLQKILQHKRLPALFVTSPQNVTYLSGFRGHASSDVLVPCLTDPEVVLFITTRAAYWIADRRHEKNEKNKERKMIRSDHNTFQRIVVEKNIFETLKELCQRFRIRNIGIEEEALRVVDFRLLKKTLRNVQPFDASILIPRLRYTKDAEEIIALTKACRITDHAFSALLRYVRIGMTEGEVAHFLVDFFHRHADGPSFAPIVASGKGAAIPHYGTSKTKKIRRGEMLLLDFGAQIGGYHADMSRTIFLGRSTSRFKKIYNLVLEAQEKTINALRIGMSGNDADAIARRVLAGYGYTPLHPASSNVKESSSRHYSTNGDVTGYKKEFAHSTGHGVGLQIHEAPRLSPLSKDTLEAHHVFTVEPGLYFPSWGGVRIEDTVLLTPKGPRLLTRSSKKLIEI